MIKTRESILGIGERLNLFMLLTQKLFIIENSDQKLKGGRD